MKFPTFAALLAVLWLTGCATTSVPTAGTNTGTTKPLTTPPAAQTGVTLAPPTSPFSLRPPPGQPIYPGGPLEPISLGQVTSPAVAHLTPPADLWERIRRGYAMPDLAVDQVRDRELWYTTRPDYIFRMTERSRKYMFHIVEELERRNMPTELALLPFVESAFNPQAVSSAKAAGMWQFMPATGKHFELTQNAFRDDRRDVLASTRAALDYLQKLYGMFGDWHLALAAYNWGEGSVGRAIAKNQRAGLGISYPELNMPDETRHYVPKLQALKNIVANPDSFSAKLPLIENHPYFQTVTITRDIDVALAARLAEVPLADFKALNPSANRPVILAAGTPQILLPWDNAAVFQRNLEAYTGAPLARWTVWTAPATLRPAEVAKRFGMSENELREVNNIPARVLIKAGSALLVPRSPQTEKDVALQIADHGQLSLAPEIVLRRTTVKARKGESVASIASRHGVSADNVALWNKVKPSAVFKAGQSVAVFLPPQSRATSMPLARTAKKTGSNPSVKVARGVKGKPVKVAKR